MHANIDVDYLNTFSGVSAHLRPVLLEDTIEGSMTGTTLHLGEDQR